MKPWEKYQQTGQQTTQKPWEKYATQQPPTETQKLEQKVKGIPSQFVEALTPKASMIPGQGSFGAAQFTSPAGLAMFAVPKLRDIQQGADIAGEYKKIGFPEKPAQIWGGLTKMAIDPYTYAGAGIAQEGLPAMVGLVGKGVKNIKGYIGAGKELQTIQKGIKGAESASISQLPRKIDETASMVKDELAQHKIDFGSKLKLASQEEATAIKPKIKEFGENLTKSYGKAVDELDNIILGQDEPLITTKSDISDMITKAMNNVSDNPKAADAIRKFAEKRGFSISEYQTMNGERAFSVFPDNYEQGVNIKDVIQFKNQFKEIDDKAYSSLRDSFGDFMATKYPSNVGQKFLEMQAEYGPMADAKWQAYKIFKPFDKAEIDISRGSKFMEDYAKNKLDLGKQKLLSMIEKGSDFSPGVGDVSSRMKSLGISGIKKETDLTRYITDLMNTKSNVEDLISQRQKFQADIKGILKKVGIVGGSEEVIRRTMFRH